MEAKKTKQRFTCAGVHKRELGNEMFYHVERTCQSGSGRDISSFFGEE
jgi:hypothetical protein